MFEIEAKVFLTALILFLVGINGIKMSEIEFIKGESKLTQFFLSLVVLSMVSVPILAIIVV